MATGKKKADRARKMLKQMREQREQAAKKLSRARRKLESRAHHLYRIEAKLSRLESQTHELRSDGKPVLSSSTKMRVARLIFNPNSGGASSPAGSLEKIVNSLMTYGIRAEVYLKTTGKAARHWAREAVDQNYDLVIASGGDGTIEDVASQLVGTKTTLGILPNGTRNNLARELGIPMDMDQACALLGTGLTRQIDVGHVVANEKPEIEYFLESAGLGLTAIVLPAGQGLRKGRLAKFSAAFLKLFELKPGPIEVELDDGQKVQANSRLVTVSNAPLLGLSFLIAPDAKMDDGLLDIAVYDGMSTAEITAHFAKTTKARRVDDPRIRFFRSRRVVIRSSERLPIAADTDPIEDRRKIEIELLPGALNAVVGNGAALTLPVEALPETQQAGPAQAPSLANGKGHAAEVAKATNAAPPLSK